MRRVQVSELKNRLSAFLRLVKRGETVEILERTTPIARLESIPPRGRRDEERLAALEQQGLVVRSKVKSNPKWFAGLPIDLELEPDVLAKILSEDRDGR